MSQTISWGRHLSLSDSLNNFLGFEEQRGSYLREKALEIFWKSERTRIRARFSSARNDNFDNSPQETTLWASLEQHFRRVTCVLIWIGFNEHFLDPRLSKLLSTEGSLAGDASLPWSLTLAQQRLGDSFGEDFCEVQCRVLEPIKIGQTRLPGQSIEKWHQLPVEDAVDTTDCDPAWNLKRVKVHREYIANTSITHVGGSASAVASTVRTTGDFQYQDIAVQVTDNLSEVDLQIRTNLGLIRSLRSDKNVADIYDTFVRDGTLYAFLPFPELGDLDTLLLGGTQCLLGQIRHKRYDFREQFPDANFYAVLHEFYGLMQALQHLNTVFQHDDQHVYSLQIELHPKNILVYPEASQPVGRWKLFKFDIAVPAPDDCSEADSGGDFQSTQMVSAGHQYGPITVAGSHNTVVIGDVINPQQTSLVTRSHQTLETSYRAPESGLPGGCDGQRVIVWSIGCMFMEVLAFCRGFTDASSRWVAQRSDLHQLRTDLSGNQFYSVEHSESSLAGTYFLRDHVQKRLQAWKSDELWSKPVRMAEIFLRRQPLARPPLPEAIPKFGEMIGVGHTSRDPQNSISRLPIEEEGSDVEAAWTPNFNVQEFVRRDRMLPASSSSMWSLKILQYVVLLSQKVPRSSTDVFWVQPLDQPLIRDAVRGSYTLKTELKWRDLRLEGRIGCAMTKSANSNGEPDYLLFANIPAGPQKLEFIHKLPQGEFLMMVTAANGIVAFCYDRFVHLRAIQGIMPDNIPAVNQVAEFVKIALRNDGLQLFVYLLQGPEHVLQVWDIGIGRTPSHVADVAVERHDPHLQRSNIFIVPCTLRNTCIIIQNNLIMVAHAGGPNEARMRSGPPVGDADSPKGGLRMTKSALSLATYGTSVLLVDNKCTIRAYRINMDRRPPSLTMIGSASLPIKNPIWVVITPTPTSDKGNKYHIVTGSAASQEHCIGVSFETSPAESGQQTLILEELISLALTDSTSASEQSSGRRRWFSGIHFG